MAAAVVVVVLLLLVIQLPAEVVVAGAVVLLWLLIQRVAAGILFALLVGRLGVGHVLSLPAAQVQSQEPGQLVEFLP